MATTTGIGRTTQPIDPDLPDFPTIIDAFDDTVRRAPDRIAIIDGNRSITYAQYCRAVAGMARRIAGYDVAGGRVVSLMLNSAEQLVTALPPWPRVPSTCR